MQKKIIALAVAAVASSAAFAQSNVTVYGVADIYAANVTNSAGTKAAAVNSGGLSGSRLGFKGVEDLGNGTKALFTLEYALALDTGTNGGPTTARQQFVGLTGGYGTVIAGRLQSLVYNHNAAFNPTFGTAVDTLANVAGTAAIGTAERLDNAVAYVAPAIGGVTLAGAYTSNAAATDVTNYSAAVRAYEASASYANGPLALGGVYRNVLDTQAVAGNGNNSYSLGGSYDLGAVKLLATFAKQEANHNSDNTKVSLYNVGAVAPVSAAGAVIVSYAASKADATTAGTDDTKRTAYAIAYKHGLSKRTALYGGFAQANGSAANASGNFAGTPGVTGNFGGTGVDGKVNVLFAGVNHSF